MIKVYKVSYTDKYSKYAEARGETGVRTEMLYADSYTKDSFECSEVMEQAILDVKEITGDDLYKHLLEHRPEWITELHVTALTNELGKLNYLPKRTTFEGKNRYNDCYELVFFNTSLEMYLTFTDRNHGEVILHLGKDHKDIKTVQKYNGNPTNQIGRWMSGGCTTESNLDFYTITEIINRIKSCTFGI